MKTRTVRSKMLALWAAVLLVLIGGTVAMADTRFHLDNVDDCTVCHDFENFDCGTYRNLEAIACTIAGESVQFTIRPDHYADSSGSRICEVCHTNTNYYRTDGTSPGGSHQVGSDCSTCHKHCDEFAASGGAGPGHDRHTIASPKFGTPLDCGDCHGETFTVFKDGQPISTTTVCNDCHSPAGAFDGVSDSTIGAKANWDLGVYNIDQQTLQSGKEQWCAGCHDDMPASSAPAPGGVAVDDPAAVFAGSWSSYTHAQQYGSGFRAKPRGTGTGTATWTPDLPEAGQYNVYAWWVDNTGKYRSQSVPYTIYYDGGSQTVYADQTDMGPGGGKWNYLGTWTFAAGTSNYVVMSDNAPAGPIPGGTTYVVADAVLFSKGGVVAAITDAPNVTGDNTDYGYYITGHKIDCLNCHDAGKTHIDGQHRTYRSSDPGPATYNNAYRLKGNDMVLPRPQASTSGINPMDFAFCLNCHNKDEVLGLNLSQADKSHTNFWDSMPTMSSIGNAHNYHLKDRSIRLDSDWNGVADSRTSCIGCHNVHGAPNGGMIRHGELISTPGTTDKVPAFNFSYLGTPTGPAATATFTATGLQDADYQVYAWWVDNTAQYRPTDATYTVTYSGGSSDVIVNQTSGGGQWNLLGTYHYDGATTGTVVIDNDYASSGMFVVADAVRWFKVGGGHEVIVDNASADFQNDQSVWKTYTGDPQTYGTDFRYIESHSTPVADPDATLVDSQGGIMNYTANNNKVCSTCHVSSHTRYVRDPNLWPKVIPIPGAVPATVPNDGTGSTTITVTIYDPDNNVTGVTIDLTAFGGSSTQAMNNNLDGTFSYPLTIASGTPDAPYVLVATATDASANTGTGRVSLLVAQPGAIYLDNADAFFTGAWSSYSGTTQEYAGGFRYKSAGTGSATAVWTPTIPAAGQYAVYAWWVDNLPAYRATNAPYTTFYDGGNATVLVNQSTTGPGGGKWNLLGTYTFAAGTSGYVRLSDNANNIVVADAVKFKPVP